ncbi:hypothetical protein ADL04_27550 [Streptomyces sp. NRRL B-3648]|nr:hypothetical protein ADL04_27550 [Streptomyces sp. NRRL B-3648]
MDGLETGQVIALGGRGEFIERHERGVIRIVAFIQAAHASWTSAEVTSSPFKLSIDLLFIDKVRDVVGLYPDPSEKALVLCGGRPGRCGSSSAGRPGRVGGRRSERAEEV